MGLEISDLRFNAFIKGLPASLGECPPPSSSIQLLVKQRDALIRDKWDKLEVLANQGLGDAYAVYRVLMRTLGTFDALNREAIGNRQALFTFHAGQKETREEFFAEVKKKLVKLRSNTSAQQLAALDALGKGKVAPHLFKDLFQEREPEDSPMIGAFVDSTVALFARSLIALTYASFNRHCKRLDSYEFGAHGGTLRESFRELINDFEEGLQANAKQLHTEVANQRPVVPAAERLAAHIEDALPELARVQASLYLYIDGLRKAQASASLLEALGTLSVKASDLTRSAFAMHAAAYYLCLQSKLVNKDPKAKEILHKTHSHSHDASYPNGKVTKLSEIGHVASGTYVEVAGFVSALTARRDGDRKLLSQVTLTDASGSSHVTAMAIFVELRNAGLVEGAYFRCSGTWKTKSAVNRERPAIEIEQLRINDLAKDSFRVQLEDLADKFVDRWPRGSNIAFGVSPHVSGGPKGKSKTLGAGELIFRPFIRS